MNSTNLTKWKRFQLQVLLFFSNTHKFFIYFDGHNSKSFRFFKTDLGEFILGFVLHRFRSRMFGVQKNSSCGSLLPRWSFRCLFSFSRSNGFNQQPLWSLQKSERFLCRCTFNGWKSLSTKNIDGKAFQPWQHSTTKYL